MIETMPNDQLHFPMDFHGNEILTKLAYWSKFVGIMNILIGILYTLSIFIMSIPTVIVGIVYILIGTKLNSASSQLKFSLETKESEGFISAIDNIRSALFLNGILFIITLVIFALVIFGLLLFGSLFKDIFYELARDYPLI